MNDFRINLIEESFKKTPLRIFHVFLLQVSAMPWFKKTGFYNYLFISISCFNHFTSLIFLTFTSYSQEASLLGICIVRKNGEILWNWQKQMTGCPIIPPSTLSQTSTIFELIQESVRGRKLIIQVIVVLRNAATFCLVRHSWGMLNGQIRLVSKCKFRRITLTVIVISRCMVFESPEKVGTFHWFFH